MTFRSKWERRIGRTDSPIEGRFLDAFCELAFERGYEVAKASGAWEGVIIIEPQKFFDRYRVDFLITYPFFADTLQLVVECDGHAFHEKSKAQVKRDKIRDRSLQAAGVMVFHFTGSEIYSAAGLCATEVLDVIEQFQTTSFTKAIDEANRKVA